MAWIHPSTAQGKYVRFSSAGAENVGFVVTAVNGREAISHYYGFEIELASQERLIDSAQVVNQPACLSMLQRVPGKEGQVMAHPVKYHGIVSSFEQSDGGPDWVLYRAVLVPTLWRLSLVTRNRIFLGKTVQAIVEQILKEHEFAKNEYEFRLHSRAYEPREYVVQYQETDLDFCSRLLEREGISFYFQYLEGDDRERVIFCDTPAGHDAIAGVPSIRYRGQGASTAPAGGDSWFHEEVVRSLTLRHKVVEKEVVLKDFNYRTPTVDLLVRAEAVGRGYGHVDLFGEHYKTKEEGNALARIRAEEIKCREVQFTGQSDVRSFRAGATFALSEHYSRSPVFERSYLITEVRHQIEQSLPSGLGGRFTATYQNEFSAIPADLPFRPRRATHVPKATGVINGIVDAPSKAGAFLDDKGRYKVQIPLDPGSGKGQSSRYLRMMQPFVGEGFGLHCPLHPGQEVMIAHVNGDWDRPIIAGAVPNENSGNVVSAGNSTQCMLKTDAGNALTLENGGPGPRVTIESPGAGTFLNIGMNW